MRVSNAEQFSGHSGIWEDSIPLTVGRPASNDAGIKGKSLGGFSVSRGQQH